MTGAIKIKSPLAFKKFKPLYLYLFYLIFSKMRQTHLDIFYSFYEYSFFIILYFILELILDIDKCTIFCISGNSYNNYLKKKNYFNIMSNSCFSFGSKHTTNY